jgi:hypothetical protein
MHRPGLGRRFSAALVAWVAALLLPVAAPGAVLAGGSSNIPGTPLPGTVVSGKLGGSIYDVVYQLTVLPGRIILVSLTGTSGTDFDLYLFDSTASTVYSNAGLVAKSTGPTSTESLSVPSPAGGTYFLDLNGASAVEGTFRLVVQQVLDTRPPAATITLDGGRTATNQLTVPVEIQSAQGLSGAVVMSFSLDGIAWTNWTPYVTHSTWTFQPGDGPRTLWVQVESGVGQVSPAASASIVVDTVAPLAVGLQPPPSGQAVGPRPTLTIRFNEPMDPGSWSDGGMIVQAADGSLVAGAYTYVAATWTGSFVPSAPLVPGVPYVATLGTVTDVAGNLAVPLGSWIFTDVLSTSMTVSGTPTTVSAGASARLAATLTGAPSPATVEVLSRTAGAADFSPIASISLADGQGSLSAAPSLTTTYRLAYAGTSTLAASSADVLISVRRGVKVSAPASAVAGRLTRITATVSPAGSAGVSFRLYRYDALRRVYTYAGSWGRTTSASGAAVYNWVPRSGTYQWRVAVTGTASYATNTSVAVRVVVR